MMTASCLAQEVYSSAKHRGPVRQATDPAERTYLLNTFVNTFVQDQVFTCLARGNWT